MPYKTKGKCVYKKDTGKKVGCTKGSVKKYLAALHINAESIDIKKIIREEINDFGWVEDVSDKKHKYTIILLNQNEDVVEIHANSIDEAWGEFFKNHEKGLDPMLFAIDDVPLKGFGGIEPRVDKIRKMYESEGFEWIEETANEFDVCDLIGLPREIVGEDIIITYGGFGPKNSEHKNHFNIPAKVVSVTEPWNDDIKLHLEAKRAGFTPGYIRCGWRFKFDS
jgi:hypothetical protein